MNTSHRPSWPTKSLASLPTQSSLTSTHAPINLALCLPPNTSHQSQLPYTTSTLTRPPSPANIKLLPITTPGPEFSSQERPQDTPSGSYKKEPHCNREEVSNSIEKSVRKKTKKLFEANQFQIKRKGAKSFSLLSKSVKGVGVLFSSKEEYGVGGVLKVLKPREEFVLFIIIYLLALPVYVILNRNEFFFLKKKQF